MNRLELRDWRKRRWLSQAALADLLGVRKITVFRWESGETTVPSFLHLALGMLDVTHDFTPEGYRELHKRGAA